MSWQVTGQGHVHPGVVCSDVVVEHTLFLCRVQLATLASSNLGPQLFAELINNSTG
jgi:hypothetical protein